VDIETDKVVLEVVAPADGRITEIRKQAGDTVRSQEVLALFEAGTAATASTTAAPAAVAAEPAAKAAVKGAGPAARKAAAEAGVDVAQLPGSGKGGRVTKEDVKAQATAPAERPQPSTPIAPPAMPVMAGEREERRVPMTRLRKRVA